MTGAVKARLAADVSFQSETGEVHPAGDAQTNYNEVALSDQAEGVIYPTVEVDSTDDSSDPNATYTLYLVNAKGREVGTVFERWVFSASFGENITYGKLQAFNQHHAPLRDLDTYTRIGTNILVLEVLGQRLLSSPNVLGILALQDPAIDPTYPIALGPNSPGYLSLLALLANRGTATLVDGVATVFSSTVAADSPIQVTSRSEFVTGALRAEAAEITPGVSFVIRSTNAGDAGDVSWSF